MINILNILIIYRQFVKLAGQIPTVHHNTLKSLEYKTKETAAPCGTAVSFVLWVLEPVSDTESETIPAEYAASGQIYGRSPVQGEVERNAGNGELGTNLSYNGCGETCNHVFVFIITVYKAKGRTGADIEIEISGTSEIKIVNTCKTETVAHETEVGLNEVCTAEIVLV